MHLNSIAIQLRISHNLFNINFLLILAIDQLGQAMTLPHEHINVLQVNHTNRNNMPAHTHTHAQRQPHEPPQAPIRMQLISTHMCTCVCVYVCNQICSTATPEGWK